MTETEGISETISEKPKRRGRMRLIPEGLCQLLKDAGMFGDIRSERGKQNVFYRQRAMEVLGLLDGETSGSYSWLYDADRMEREEPRAWRPTILAELGRIADDDRLREVALQVCMLKPKTRDAVVMIRRFRLGRNGRGSAEALADELTACVNDYLCRYPHTDWSDILAALNVVSRRVRDTAEAEGG